MDNNVIDRADQKLEKLLVEAMNSEIKAKEFYENAAMKAKSRSGKKLFKELAEFEQTHYEKVKKIIASLNQDRRLDNIEYGIDIPKIRSEIEGEFEGNKNEIINVINLAIEAEKNAQERYKQIAQMIDDEEGKNIFNDFAREERNHQRILEDELYQLSNKGTIIWE
jgi:rubrerythrin